MEPTLHKPIPMETRVRFPRGLNPNATDYQYGTVVGVASLHVLFTYIVLLDEPMDSAEGRVRAVGVIGPLLESADGTKNWRLDQDLSVPVEEAYANSLDTKRSAV